MTRPKLKMLKLPLRMADTPWEAMQKRAQAERKDKRQQKAKDRVLPEPTFLDPIVIRF